MTKKNTKLKTTHFFVVLAFTILLSPFLALAQSTRDANEPLKIDSNCEPESITISIYLKTLTEKQTKYWWLQQKYAVERHYHASLRSQRASEIEISADNQIAEIERQRDAALRAARGLPPPKENPKWDARIAKTEDFLSSSRQRRAANLQSWYSKCIQYTDERSR